MRIQREQALRRAHELRLVAALRRQRRADRRARRVEARSPRSAPVGLPEAAVADAGMVPAGRGRGLWSALTKTRDINIGKV